MLKRKEAKLNRPLHQFSMKFKTWLPEKAKSRSCRWIHPNTIWTAANSFAFWRLVSLSPCISLRWGKHTRSPIDGCSTSHPVRIGNVQSAAKTLTNGIKKNKVRFFLWSIFMKICMQVPILYRNTYIKSEKSRRLVCGRQPPRAASDQSGTCAHYSDALYRKKEERKTRKATCVL